MMIPSPSAEASTPGSRTQGYPIRRGDFVSVGYGQSQWAHKSGMVGEPCQCRRQQLLGGATSERDPPCAVQAPYISSIKGAVMATTATTPTTAAAMSSAAGGLGAAPVPKPVSADQLDQLPWLS